MGYVPEPSVQPTRYMPCAACECHACIFTRHAEAVSHYRRCLGAQQSIVTATSSHKLTWRTMLHARLHDASHAVATGRCYAVQYDLRKGLMKACHVPTLTCWSLLQMEMAAV